MQDCKRIAREIDSELQLWCGKERERYECFKADPMGWRKDWYDDPLYRGVVRNSFSTLIGSDADTVKDRYVYAKILKNAISNADKKVVTHMITHPSRCRRNFSRMLATTFFSSYTEPRKKEYDWEKDAYYITSQPLYVLKESIESAILLHDIGRDAGADRMHGKKYLMDVESALNGIYPRQPGRVKAIRTAIEWHDHKIPEKEGDMARLIHHFLYLADKSDICGMRGLACVFEEDKFNKSELKEWPQFLKNLEPLYGIPYLRDSEMELSFGNLTFPYIMKQKHASTMKMYKLCLKGDKKFKERAKYEVFAGVINEMSVLGSMQTYLNGFLGRMELNSESADSYKGSEVLGIVDNVKFCDMINYDIYEGVFGETFEISPSEKKNYAEKKIFSALRKNKGFRELMNFDDGKFTINLRNLFGLRPETFAYEKDAMGAFLEEFASALCWDNYNYFRNKKTSLLGQEIIDVQFPPEGKGYWLWQEHPSLEDHNEWSNKRMSLYKAVFDDWEKNYGAFYDADRLSSLGGDVVFVNLGKNGPIRKLVERLLPYVDLTTEVEESNEDVAPEQGC